MRILEVLQHKDDQAYKNIGDPSVFMNVYDAAKEEQLTEAAMAEGMTPEQFDSTYRPKADEGEDFLSLFLAPVEPDEAQAASPTDHIAEVPSLFRSDFDYCRDGLATLAGPGAEIQWQADKDNRRIVVTAPPDLQVRLRQLPREIWPDSGQFVLTDDPGQIQKEVQRCRQDETAWPKLHYLWPQHVVMDWLVDRLHAAFGRHRAPVIRLPALGADEATFIVSGTIPNRKGQPLVVHWLVASFSRTRLTGLDDLAAWLERTGLGATPLANTGRAQDLGPLQRLLPAAIDAVRQEVIRRRDAFDRQMRAQLTRQQAELARLKSRQIEQLERTLARSEQAQVFKNHRRAERSQEINQIFDDYQRWVADTLTTERDPYIQVIAAVAGER
jgi:hypothetical protein